MTHTESPPKTTTPALAVQAWTFRDDLRQWPGKTLSQLRQFGINQLELAGTANLDPLDFNCLCQSHDFEVVSIHQPSPTPENIQTAIDEAKWYCDAFHCRTVVVPMNPLLLNSSTKARPEDVYSRFADACTRIGNNLAGHGVRLGYHVYHFDLHPFDSRGSSTRCGLDVLHEKVALKDLFFQFDTYWAACEQRSLAKLLTDYPKRADFVHINDINNKGAQCPVGQGQIDWSSALAALCGTTSLVLEHDTSTPMAWIRDSLDYLRQQMCNQSLLP